VRHRHPSASRTLLPLVLLGHMARAFFESNTRDRCSGHLMSLFNSNCRTLAEFAIYLCLDYDLFFLIVWAIMCARNVPGSTMCPVSRIRTFSLAQCSVRLLRNSDRRAYSVAATWQREAREDDFSSAHTYSKKLRIRAWGND